MKKIAVIGAGISGLTTSYKLSKAGHDVTVFEAQDQAGGPVCSFERDGYLLETGPHSLLVRHKEVADLLDELGLSDSIVEAGESAKKRYVVRDGRPVALPMSPGEAATTSVLSMPARLRVLLEPFVGRFDENDIDETLARFIARRLGTEVLEYLVDPFVGGVWAGDPRKLSARHSFPTLVEFEQSEGSIIVGAVKQLLTGGGSPTETSPRRLISFESGMGTLIEGLTDRLGDRLRLDSPVTKLRRDDDGWRVIYQRGRAYRGETFDAVVLTVPMYNLGQIQWENAEPPPGTVEELTQMPHAPCCVISLGFAREDVGHPLDGFGMLIPRLEEFNILGALFVSSMFPGRSPEGSVQLTAFIGGTRQPELTSEDDDYLIDMACHDLGRLLDVSGDPQFSNITRWKQAIPQYEVGHQVFLDHLDDIEAELPGIFFAGNFRDGIGIPDLLKESTANARKIKDFLV